MHDEDGEADATEELGEIDGSKALNGLRDYMIAC